MASHTRVLASLALALAVFAPAVALADLQDYTTETPERIEKEIREERKAYRETMAQIFELENGSMDKNSMDYKSRHDELLQKAVSQKVRLDEMREALAIQQKAFGGQ